MCQIFKSLEPLLVVALIQGKTLIRVSIVVMICNDVCNDCLCISVWLAYVF